MESHGPQRTVAFEEKEEELCIRIYIFISQFVIILPMCMQVKNTRTTSDIFNCVKNVQINIKIMSVYKF